MRFTLSKRGIGTSVGGGPFRIGVGATGQVRRTVRIPGTDVYNTKVVGRSRRRARGGWTDRHPFLTLLLFGLAIWFIVANWKGLLEFSLAAVLLVLIGAFVWGCGKSVYESVLESRAEKHSDEQDAPAATDGDEQIPQPYEGGEVVPQRKGAWASFTTSFMTSLRNGLQPR
ncbi:hypothetical protein TUM20984_50660 [Mycobacterium antarcticum]|nr:hypothetical protein TUM20984_50660 [Mycolicibacterium sp. TUM20984]